MPSARVVGVELNLIESICNYRRTKQIVIKNANVVCITLFLAPFVSIKHGKRVSRCAVSLVKLMLACSLYPRPFSVLWQTLEEQITCYFHDIGDPPKETLGKTNRTMCSISCLLLPANPEAKGILCTMTTLRSAWPVQ